MAAEVEQLKAHRTKLMARVQKAREQRSRREMLEAQDAVEEAQRQKEAAEQALVDGAQERIAELRAYYDGLKAKKGGIGNSIQALRDTEQALAKAQQQREVEVRSAVTAIGAAKAFARQAAAACAAQTLLSQKRDKLAERCFKEARMAESKAEEDKAEEESADRLAAAKPEQYCSPEQAL